MSTLTALTPGTQATIETAAMICQSTSRLFDYADAETRADALGVVMDDLNSSGDYPWNPPEIRLPRLSAYYGVPAMTLRENPGAALAVLGLRIVPRHVIEQGYAVPYQCEIGHYPTAFRALAVAEVGCRCDCPGTHLLMTDSALRVLDLDWQADEFPRFWPELHNVGCDGGYEIDPNDL